MRGKARLERVKGVDMSGQIGFLHRMWAFLGASILVVGMVLVQGASPVRAASQVFGLTNGSQTYTVPVDVCSVAVDAFGASGGHVGTPGGLGGEATATFSVTSGETLQVNVGGQGRFSDTNAGGAGGFNGGGGGGKQSGLCQWRGWRWGRI